MPTQITYRFARILLVVLGNWLADSTDRREREKRVRETGRLSRQYIMWQVLLYDMLVHDSRVPASVSGVGGRCNNFRRQFHTVYWTGPARHRAATLIMKNYVRKVVGVDCPVWQAS